MATKRRKKHKKGGTPFSDFCASLWPSPFAFPALSLIGDSGEVKPLASEMVAL
jgi:hypothetical protein